MIPVRLAPLVALGLLADLLGQQHAHRARVQLHCALAAGRLDRAEHQAPVQLGAVRARRDLVDVLVNFHELLLHGQHARGEVDITPAKASGLAAAQAGRRDHLEQRPVPLIAHGVVEELAKLGRLPRAHLRAGRGGQILVHGGGHVGADQLEP